MYRVWNISEKENNAYKIEYRNDLYTVFESEDDYKSYKARVAYIIANRDAAVKELMDNLF